LYFQLRKDTDKWFKGVAGHYATKFDLYYLCLMVGFAAHRKAKAESSEVTDLTDDYPKEFKSRGRLLVALLVNTELSSMGIDLDERDAVYREIARLIAPDSRSYLTDEGMRLMNQYAHGGFGALCEHFEDRPRTIETFIREYAGFIDELQKSSV
jgi:hypothetical protein